MSTANEHTAMIYIHWNDHTDRYTTYKVPYDIAKAIDKLLEKNQVEEKSDYRRQKNDFNNIDCNTGNSFNDYYVN